MCVKASGAPLLTVSVWGWGRAQLVQYLFNMYKPCVLALGPYTSAVSGACHDPNNQEVEAGRSKVQVILSWIVSSRLA